MNERISNARLEPRSASDDEGDEGLTVPVGVFLSALSRAWRLNVAIVSIFLAFSSLYLTVRQPHYQAVAIIGPAADDPIRGAGLSSALATTGLSAALGNPNSGTYDKYLQVLRSKRLAEMLQSNQSVLQHLYDDQWNEKQKKWEMPSNPFSRLKLTIRQMLGRPWPPTTDDLADELDNLVDVTSVQGSGVFGLTALKSQIMTVTVTYKDREYAIALLGSIIRDADIILRQDKLHNTSNRIQYLSALTRRTTDVYLLNSLSQILMDQERTLMVLNADRFYAVDVIDPANASRLPHDTPAWIVLIGSLLFGVLCSSAVVFLILHRRLTVDSGSDVDPLALPFPDPIGAIGRTLVHRFRRLSPQSNEQTPSKTKIF